MHPGRARAPEPRALVLLLPTRACTHCLSSLLFCTAAGVTSLKFKYEHVPSPASRLHAGPLPPGEQTLCPELFRLRPALISPPHPLGQEQETLPARDIRVSAAVTRDAIRVPRAAREYVTEWVQLCSHKTLLTKTG